MCCLCEIMIECVWVWGVCYDVIVLCFFGGIDLVIMFSCFCMLLLMLSIVCLNYFFDGVDGDECGYVCLVVIRVGCVLVEC